MTTTAERTRFTISVEPEVYEAFADLAHSSGVSLSRCIGDWLRDTAEAAQMTTIRLNEVRKSPQDALQAFLHAQAPEIERLTREGLRNAWGTADRRPESAARAAVSSAGASLSPRPVIRGGKSPGKTRGGKS